MIPVSTDEVVRFTPAYYEHMADAPVYILGVPSLKQRMTFRREMQAQGVIAVDERELIASLCDGIREVVEPSQHDELIELVEFYQVASLEEKTRMAKEIEEVERSVSRHYAPYRRLVADRDYWNNVAPVLAFQLFVRGWDNVNVSYECKHGMVQEAVLNQLPPADVIAVGFKLLALMIPNGDMEKNSVSPSNSTSGRTATSNLASTRLMAKAGKSTAKSIKKTRGGRSKKVGGTS